MSLMSQRYRVIALDLPGHGFSEPPRGLRLTLPFVSKRVGVALQQEGILPEIVCGHSAGAAVLARMILDDRITPRVLISLNGAFFPFKGMAGALFPPMARLLFINPIMPWFLAGQAQRIRNVERLLQSQGDPLSQADVDLYARLLRYPGHIEGAMAMMAHWELRPLLDDLHDLSVPLHAIAGDRDRSVAPSDADEICHYVPNGTVHHLVGVGHLAHEHDPERVAQLMRAIVAQYGL